MIILIHMIILMVSGFRYLRVVSQMVCFPAVVFGFSSIAVEKPKLIYFDLMLLQTRPTFTYSLVVC